MKQVCLIIYRSQMHDEKGFVLSGGFPPSTSKHRFVHLVWSLNFSLGELELGLDSAQS